MPTYNEDLNINGEVNITGTGTDIQLVVQGEPAQTIPLQQWQDSSNTLARITGDGRLQVGSFNDGEMATDDSLIEAHRGEADTTKPKRGMHLMGAISSTLSSAVSWVVQELTLKGTSGVAALHTALRVRLRNEATGAQEIGAELRGADVEVTHAGTSSGATLSQVMGLRVAVNQETGATTTNLYGIKVDVPTEGYALHAPLGKVHFGNLGTGIVRATEGLLSTDTANDINVIDIPGTWGETLAVKDAIYLNEADGKWYKIDIDVTPVLMGRVRGFISSGAGSGSGTVRLYGRLEGFSSLTPGQRVYASTTAGGIVTSRPTVTVGGLQQIIVDMGWVDSTTSIFIDPKATEYLKRVLLSNTTTTTIEHHTDPAGRNRQIAAYVSSNEIGVLESYASSHQDWDLQLRGQNGGSNETVTPASSGISVTALGAGSTANFKQAQKIVLAGGQLTQISFELIANTGSISDPILVEIRANNGTIPATTSLWSKSHTAVPSSNNIINIPDGPLLATGTYWLVLSVPTQPLGTRYNLLYDNNNPYAAGMLKADSSASPGTWGINGTTQDANCSVTTSQATAYDKLAQSFSHTSTTALTSVNLYLKKVGSPSGTLTLAIHADDGSGSPPATAITDTTVSANSLTTTYGFVSFTFASQPTITTNTPYWLVLTTSDGQSNTNYVVWGIDKSAPSYTNGVIKTYASSAWTATPTADGCFEIYGVATTFDEPCVIGRYSSGTRDLGVRYDDGAGANGDTKTTFKNVSGVTLDVTCVVRLN